MNKIVLLTATFMVTMVDFLSADFIPPPPPILNDVEILTPSVEKYDKFEVRLDLEADFVNPYDYDQILVQGSFTAPSGSIEVVDGFFMRNYTLNEPAGNLFVGDTEFRVRYAPKEVGQYEFFISVTDVSGTISSSNFNFSVSEITDDLNKGFVRTSNTNYLQFDDESIYIPIGENIAWEDNNVYQDFKKWLTPLVDNGGNFFRLWHAHWGLGIEWSNGNGFAGLRDYNQSNSFYQDWLYDFCAENGIYVMLALQHHGPVSTGVNPNWNDSPYNVANGGPCQNTVDFFTNETAIAHTKNRYRYILARWGYSRNILCWELFNEVHWTDNFQLNKPLVAEWHIEMADYLKSLDPNKHIVTTSYGESLEDAEVWNDPNIDITQSHIYRNSSNIEKILANTNDLFLQEYQKPTLNGEFGLGGNSGLANQDPDGIHFHNSMWGSLFGGGLGTSMTWWWESYIHPRDLYFHFFGVDKIANEIDFLEKNLSPAHTTVTDAPGYLKVVPNSGWGTIGTSDISINNDGSFSPSSFQLNEFLYGALWNTQFRSPPTFSVDYPNGGAFSVRTGGELGTAPSIVISVDGAIVLESPGQTNTTYTVQIPTGSHTIKVDNQGTDWIMIAEYSFENLGSAVDAYFLTSEDNDYAAGWVLNNQYNHNYISENGIPEETPATVWVDGFADGVYAIHLMDPADGTIISSGDAATAENGLLEIPIPPILWDIAVLVDDSPVSTSNVSDDLQFAVFPNPATLGARIILETAFQGPFDLTLIDTNGKKIIEKSNTTTNSFTIPQNLTAGYYWLKIRQNGRIGIKALVIAE